MTVEELRKAVDAMLRRAPKAEAVASAKNASEFKTVVKNAQAAKSKEKLESALNQLKRYY